MKRPALPANAGSPGQITDHYIDAIILQALARQARLGFSVRW